MLVMPHKRHHSSYAAPVALTLSSHRSQKRKTWSKKCKEVAIKAVYEGQTNSGAARDHGVLKSVCLIVLAAKSITAKTQNLDLLMSLKVVSIVTMRTNAAFAIPGNQEIKKQISLVLGTAAGTPLFAYKGGLVTQHKCF